MIKILYVTDYLKQRYGVTSVIINYISNMKMSNIQIDLLAYEGSDESVVKRLEFFGCKVFFMPKITIKSFLTLNKFFNSFFANHQYDIVHSHFNQIDSMLFSIAKKNGTKKCISHSHNVKLSESRIKAARNYFLCIGLKRQADIWAACSNEAGEALFGKGFSKSNKKKIFRNGISCDKFSFDIDARNYIRNELKLTEQDILIGSIGSLKPQKNYSFLLKVLLQIRKINDNYKLILIGDGPLADELKEQAVNLKIENYVIFAGVRSDVHVVINALDVFVLPSLYEGLGISAVEAQANGLPCVLSDAIPNEADLTGVLFLNNKLNPEIWAKAIIAITRPRDLTQNEIVKKNGYDISSAAQDLEAFYRTLMN